MAWLLALALIFSVAFVIRHHRRQSAIRSRQSATSQNRFVSVSVRAPTVESKLVEGSVPRALADGRSWVINPKSSFPLTIYPTDEETARQIKFLLDNSSDRLRTNESLQSIMLEKGLRCKEIDVYIARFRPKYLAAIEKLKHVSAEWTNASELDRDDLLQEFQTKAVEVLEVSPAAICDVQALFECQPDFENVRDFYVHNDTRAIELCKLHRRYAQNDRKVFHLVASDRYRRPDFEKLCEAGLAARGLQIPIADILNSLTLKDLRELMADCASPSFRRKADAVEYAAALGDIADRLGKLVALRELFRIRPLPDGLLPIASELSSERMFETVRFAHEASALIAHTYAMGAYDLRDRSDPDLQKIALGWRIIASEGSCAMCKKAAERLFSKGNRPRVPLHLGCRCDVETKLRSED